ncbi:MAG: hypothetical protein R2747_09995 [Pyrinomonadaceae bacterium]
MSGKLTVNPFLQLELHATDNFHLLAPKPGCGLQMLPVSRTERPALYELFLELSGMQFDFLDIERDLSRDERRLLSDHGVLIEEKNVPQKPLFACQLDEVEAASFEAARSDLIVNPTYRFEPFSFANLAVWMREKHLSPHQASAWISSPATGIEIGYWLEKERAETMAGFRAGKKPSSEIDDELLGKLMAAEIIGTAEDFRRREKGKSEVLERKRGEFQKRGYAVLEQILPPAQMKAMRDFYRQYVAQGFMPLGDPQVSLRFRQHNEPLARFFHLNFTGLMSLLIGEEVRPSYVYAASYKEGAALEPHTDREQCEYSISFQVDYQPEPADQTSPWALHLTRPEEPIQDNSMFGWDDFPETLPGGQKRKGIHLASGDGLIYKGRELIHYRYPLPAGHRSTSLFFHYVPKDFGGNLL